MVTWNWLDHQAELCPTVACQEKAEEEDNAEAKEEHEEDAN